jgi:hypothetical protein
VYGARNVFCIPVEAPETILETTVPDWIQGDILSHLENLMHAFDD